MILDTMTTIRMRTTKGLFTRLGTWSSWSSCSSSLSQYVAFVFVIVWLCSKHIKLFEQLTHVYWDGLSFILPLVQQHPCTSSKLETTPLSCPLHPIRSHLTSQVSPCKALAHGLGQVARLPTPPGWDRGEIALTLWPSLTLMILERQLRPMFIKQYWTVLVVWS